MRYSNFTDLYLASIETEQQKLESFLHNIAKNSDSFKPPKESYGHLPSKLRDDVGSLQGVQQTSAGPSGLYF